MNTIEKLLKAYNINVPRNIDNWTLQHQYIANHRKWVGNIVPAELFKRDLSDAINSILTLSQDDVFYKRNV